MLVLITGGTGFIGSKTVKKLQLRGHKVKLFKGDVRKIEDWKKNLQGGEAVLHLAARRTETDEDFKVNVKGTENLFLAAKSTGKLPSKVVLASSQAVYMGCKSPFEENMASKPTTIYGKSKFEAEKITLFWGKKLNIPVVILRYSTVLGPGVREKSNMSGPLYKWAKNALVGKPIEIFGDGKQTRDYIHVDDVAEANLLALESNVSGIFNVGGGKKVSLLTLAKLVKKATGGKNKIVITGKITKNDPRHLFSDISKLKKLGWSPKGKIRRAVKELAFGLKGKIK